MAISAAELKEIKDMTQNEVAKVLETLPEIYRTPHMVGEVSDIFAGIEMNLVSCLNRLDIAFPKKSSDPK